MPKPHAYVAPHEPYPWSITHTPEAELTSSLAKKERNQHNCGQLEFQNFAPTFDEKSNWRTHSNHNAQFTVKTLKCARIIIPRPRQ